MTATPPNPLDATGPLLKRIWRDYLKRRWPRVLLALICAAGVAGLSGLLTQVLKPAIDGLIVQRGAQADVTVRLGSWAAFAVNIPLAIVVLALMRAGLQMLQTTTVNRAGHEVVGDMQVQLFGRFVRADLSRLRSTHSGEYLSSVLFDANLIRQAFTDGVVNWTQQSLMVVAMLAVMFANDPLLAGLALVAGPIVAVVIGRFGKKTRKAAKGAMAETSNLSTAIMESLDGVKIVKIENREADEERRVAEVVGRRQAHVIKGANAKALATPTTEAMTMIVVAGILLVAGWRASTAGMTVGNFTVFITALLTAAQSLRQLANLQAVFSEGFTAARRLFQVLDVEPEIREPAKPTALAAGPCAIALDQVGFAYHGGAPALNGVTLKAAPGETVALVGPSGGGKSTILNLIPRFYDAETGAVTINGTDVRELAVADLRGRIALVTQEPFLFDDTIRANIAYARPSATEAEIVAAAEAAAAHEFITGLPNGYDTTVGEAGGRLSGGQRQRIAIARAFLKDAPILLLDEATSALDTESEAKVQAALERLMEGRTTLMIAHRLSTVKHADRIYVIEAGKVVEQGSHAALVKKGGLYARLAKSQDLDTVPAGS